MKYIRTKDGLYKCSTIPYCVPNSDGTKLLIKEGLSKEYPVIEYDIVNQSDSIAELCDEIVLIDKYNCPHFISPDQTGDAFSSYCEIYDDNDPPKSYSIKPTDKVYGAIWTEKGLIYTAKINDKGALELL